MSTQQPSEMKNLENPINKYLLSPQLLHQLALKDYIDAQKHDSLAGLDSAAPPTTQSSVPPSATQSTKVLEVDPLGKSAKQPGSKLDAGKPDVLRGAIQYFPRALSAVARVSELGAAKYSWKGWESVPNGIARYGAAMARHLGHDDFATDSGAGGLGSETLHAAQAAWNSLARLELILKELDENPNAGH
jgi:Domain of unknown function (DUF5664)